MFRIVCPATLSLRVEITPPEEVGAPGACTVDLRYMGQQARGDYLRRISDEQPTDRQILDELLIGWDGIEDESGAALDFNHQPTRRRVLDVPWVYCAIRDAVLRELGLAEAAAKNS